MANITLLGASYTDVPAVDLPQTGGGTVRFYENGGGGSGYTRTVIVSQQTVTPTYRSDGGVNGYVVDLSNAITEPLAELSEYIVTFNGTEYFSTATLMWGSNVLIGDVNWFWGGSDLPYPFGILYYDGECTLAVGSGDALTIKVEKLELTGSGGGGDATLITKTITANGTYSAEDDDADGYSSVTVNVPSGSSKNVQTAQTTNRRNNTALGSIISLTCSTAGTYDVYWGCARTSTSGTWGSQLYINGSAYDTENTAWSNNAQNNHLTGVTIPANATVEVYGRSRSGYYICVPQLTIVQTA